MKKNAAKAADIFIHDDGDKLRYAARVLSPERVVR